jgi:hypothetical protein
MEKNSCRRFCIGDFVVDQNAEHIRRQVAFSLLRFKVLAHEPIVKFFLLGVDPLA